MKNSKFGFIFYIIFIIIWLYDSIANLYKTLCHSMSTGSNVIKLLQSLWKTLIEFETILTSVDHKQLGFFQYACLTIWQSIACSILTIFMFSAKICNQFTCFPLDFFIMAFLISVFWFLYPLLLVYSHSSWYFGSNVHFAQHPLGFLECLCHFASHFLQNWLHMLSMYWIFDISFLLLLFIASYSEICLLISPIWHF